MNKNKDGSSQEKQILKRSPHSSMMILGKKKQLFVKSSLVKTKTKQQPAVLITFF